MARIKIKDLPRKAKVSREEMKRVLGGYTTRQALTSLSGSSLQMTGSSTSLSGSTVGMVGTMSYRPLLGSQFLETEEELQET